MPPRRPTAAHVVHLTHQGQARQFITTSAADLARQVRGACPTLPPSIVEMLAKIATDHQGRADLPGLANIRHVSTLAPVQREGRDPKAQRGPVPDGATL